MLKHYLAPLLLALLLPTGALASDLSAEAVDAPSRWLDIHAGRTLDGGRIAATIYISDFLTFEIAGHTWRSYAGSSMAIGHSFELSNSRGANGAGIIVDLTPAIGCWNTYKSWGERKFYDLQGNEYRADFQGSGLLAQVNLGWRYFGLSHLGWSTQFTAGLKVKTDDWKQPNDPRVLPHFGFSTGPSF
jgi:hypothetical protein